MRNGRSARSFTGRQWGSWPRGLSRFVVFVLTLGLVVCVEHRTVRAAPALVWERVLTDLPGRAASAVTVDGEGGFVVAGQAPTARKYIDTLWVMRVDGTGERLWLRHFPDLLEAGAKPVLRRLSDGTIAMAGALHGRAGGLDTQSKFWAVYLTPEGKTVRRWDVADTPWSLFLDIEIMADGGVVFAGSQWTKDLEYPASGGGEDASHARVARYGPAGQKEWDRTYARLFRHNTMYRIVSYSDAHLLGFAASSGLGGPELYWLLPLDKSGNPGDWVGLSVREDPHLGPHDGIGGKGGQVGEPREVRPMDLAVWSDGHVLAATERIGGYPRLLKRRPGSLRPVWGREYPAISYRPEFVLPLSDGGAVMAGLKDDVKTESAIGCKHARMVGLDPAGEVRWEVKSAQVHALARDGAGGFIAAGYRCDSNMPWLARYRLPVGPQPDQPQGR